ncbi:MFS family permease [Microbacterium terrae]|uniref:Proline/betaine transporter n=1 Tax=Microbacterium terrae TaxID=69369 RepID=A0A0M2HFH6_9MICO|nr:MFS transporter [Microbacterium terrae]KJL45414.1 Proline/betaine transporter [Microbacterium terrae]MBP1078714.1 MFS family permease [Microbacterium terrae]GLJ98116.1 MFS transporter [Microbacterium terrae]
MTVTGPVSATDPASATGSASVTDVASAAVSPPAAAGPETARASRRAVVAASAGTVLEWYDFFLYGTAAALVFPTLFFPESAPGVAVLLSLAVFATGFVARPLGGIAAAWLGDRAGRRTALIATVVVMGVATAGIGVLPTYAQAGALAPALLVLLRLAQGAATGGEWGGAALLAVEGARSRGARGAFVQSAVYVGLILGNLAFVVLTLTLDEAALLSWGWRIPFLASLALLAIALLLRRGVAETPEFVAARAADRLARRPVVDALRRPRSVVAVFLMRVGQNTAFYIVSVFCLGYAVNTLGLDRSVTLTALLVGAGLAAVLCPLWGRLGDRIGPFPLVAGGLVALGVLAVPLFAVLEGGVTALVVGVVALAIGVANAAADSVQPAWFAALFDAPVRYSGITLGREAGAIVGGGLAPLAAAALAVGVGHWWPVAVMMVLAAGLGLVGAVLARTMTTDI